MPRARKPTDMSGPLPLPPADSSIERERMLKSMACNVIEKRMQDGTASSQELVAVLRMDSERERLELDNLRRKNELLTAQAEAARAQNQAEDATNRVIQAILRYRGEAVVDDEEDPELR